MHKTATKGCVILESFLSLGFKLERHGQTGNTERIGMAEVSPDCIQPAGNRNGIIIDERYDLIVRLEQGTVPGAIQARFLFTHIADRWEFLDDLIRVWPG